VVPNAARLKANSSVTVDGATALPFLPQRRLKADTHPTLLRLSAQWHLG
jgi:hypothetical protein